MALSLLLIVIAAALLIVAALRYVVPAAIAARRGEAAPVAPVVDGHRLPARSNVTPGHTVRGAQHDNGTRPELTERIDAPPLPELHTRLACGVTRAAALLALPLAQHPHPRQH